ncbi:hypothetical protein ACLMJK_009350 [Lecanora helva]
MGASLGLENDLTGAGTLGFFVRLSGDKSLYILTCNHNIRGTAGVSVADKRFHHTPIKPGEKINVVIPANTHTATTQSTLRDKLKAAEDELKRCDYGSYPFEVDAETPHHSPCWQNSKRS